KEVIFILPLLIPTGIAFLIALWFVIQYEHPIALIALLASLALFYGIYYFWTNTDYEIKGDRLYYRSISVKGNVPIKKINRIEPSTYPTKGNRPALALTGINIIYSGGQSLFIAPEDQAAMIKALKSVNRRIKIVEKVA
ncbi:MAG: PH domain-containing protein, partial [Bacteroidota bacterium]